MANDEVEKLVALIHELRQLPREIEWVEFKHNNDNPQEIGEYASALANSAAIENQAFGHLVWGIDNDTHAVVGTTFRPKAAKKGNEELENWLAHKLTPAADVRFHGFEIDGIPVAIMTVGRSTHQPVQFEGVEYIRVGSYKKKLKDHADKARRLWDSFNSTPFERQIAAERLEAAEVLKLLDYPSYFRLLDVPLPEDRVGILRRLADDGVIAGRTGDRWDITNLGALLFASDLSRFPGLARKAVRVVQYDGESRVKTKRERPTDKAKGYATGFEELIAYIKAILPENEVVGAAFREAVPMYPEPAIRELVPNALIHQDFSITGAGPFIEVFDGRLEVTNPGKPLVDTQRFLDMPPRSRNEGIASFMRRLNICEERGSGIDKVVFQTEVYQLPAPLFEVVGDNTRAVLFAHRPFPGMEREDQVRACYLHACLQAVQGARLTNTSLRRRFGVEEDERSRISRIIRDTVKAGLIKPYERGRESRRHVSYVPFWG